MNTRPIHRDRNEQHVAFPGIPVITDMQSDPETLVDALNLLVIAALAVHDVMAASATLTAYLLVIAAAPVIRRLMNRDG